MQSLKVTGCNPSKLGSKPRKMTWELHREFNTGERSWVFIEHKGNPNVTPMTPSSGKTLSID